MSKTTLQSDKGTQVPLRPSSYFDSPIWVKEYQKRQQEEDEQYNKEMSQPYYLIHLKPTKELWRQLNLKRQSNQGVITKGEYNNAVSRAIVRPVNKYFRELKHDMSKGNIPKGKYTIPATILGGVGLGSLFDIPLFVNAAVIGGAEGANLAANGISKVVTGRNLALNVSKYTGFDPEPAEIVSSLPTAVAGGKWGYNSLRRGIETAMRTTAAANPLPTITTGVNLMIKGNNGGKKRLYHIGKYILTGRKTGNDMDYYRSFAMPNPMEASKEYAGYNGFTFSDARDYGHNDVIDAFLYGKEIDPYYGLTKVSLGKDFGIHDKYVYENYAGKAKKIPVYESNMPQDGLIEVDPNEVINTKVVSADGSIHSMGANENLRSINVAGHLINRGTAKTGEVAGMHLDIWKFNWKDYWDRWILEHFNDILNSEYQQYLRKKHPIKYKLKDGAEKFILKLGLKTVDYTGTPIITRSKWGKATNTINDPFIQYYPLEGDVVFYDETLPPDFFVD